MTFLREQVAALSVGMREAAGHLIAGRDSAFTGALDALAFESKAYLQGVHMVKKNLTKQIVIVRTFSAGVHYGELVSREGKEVVLANARRLWSWQGAASLSQLASMGTSKPSACKFSVPVPSIVLTEAIEIIETTPAAQDVIAKVPEWTA